MKRIIVKMAGIGGTSYRKDQRRVKEFLDKPDDSEFDITLRISHLDLLKTYDLHKNRVEEIVIKDFVDGTTYETTLKRVEDKNGNVSIRALNKDGKSATNRIIRIGHSLYRMYLGGEFF